MHIIMWILVVIPLYDPSLSPSLSLPIEYCGSRADPSVEESQYLKHIGEHLHPDIDIMWTGNTGSAS